MKGFKKIFLSFLAFSLAMGCLSSTSWAEDKWVKNDPVGQGWSALDLIFARPDSSVFLRESCPTSGSGATTK